MERDFDKTGYNFLTNLEIPYAKFLCEYFFRWLLLDKSFPLKSRVDSNPSLQRGSLPFNFKPDPLQFQLHSKITHAHQSDVQTVDITYAKFQPTWDKEFGACIWESFFSFRFFSLVFLGWVAMVACPPTTSVVTTHIFVGFPNEDWL